MTVDMHVTKTNTNILEEYVFGTCSMVETISSYGFWLQQNFTDVVQVDGEKKISWIIQFIRKYLKLEQSDSLFLYVNQAFSPSPDQTVSNLNECFGSADNKLVLYYSRSECWG